MKRMVWALAALGAFALVPQADAASNPLGAAVENLFTIRPGGSAPPMARDYGGGACPSQPDPHVVWGRFAGGRDMGSGDGTRTVVHTTQGCFTSARDCETWMLALKTRYNRRPIYHQCRLGYEPGAPVPPWWAPKPLMVMPVPR